MTAIKACLHCGWKGKLAEYIRLAAIQLGPKDTVSNLHELLRLRQTMNDLSQLALNARVSRTQHSSALSTTYMKDEFTNLLLHHLSIITGGFPSQIHLLDRHDKTNKTRLGVDCIANLFLSESILIMA